VPPVHVDDIAEDLEGIEADADGQGHPQQRHRQPGDGVEAGDQKVGILAVGQHPQAQHGGQGQQGKVIDQARQSMIESGRHQWTEEYPSEKDIRKDIENGNAFVLTVNEEVVVYGAVILNGEPKYKKLVGNWITEGDYYVIHRFATLPSFQREGLARIFISKVNSMCEVEKIPSIKVDTNFDNTPMINLLSSMGFCICGRVNYGGNRGQRFAFEKLSIAMEPAE
ncbi:acetyltransferase, gnat family protein, partial [human gut metagenome]